VFGVSIIRPTVTRLVASFTTATNDDVYEDLHNQIGVGERRQKIGVGDLAPYVGCRRVVLLPKRRHSVSCRRHVADMFQSCRIHKKMSCRQGVQNDTTFTTCRGIPTCR